MIPGDKVGLANDKCAVAIIRSSTEIQNLWYLGAIVMNKNYIVYDMTSFVERNN